MYGNASRKEEETGPAAMVWPAVPVFVSEKGCRLDSNLHVHYVIASPSGSS